MADVSAPGSADTGSDSSTGSGSEVTDAATTGTYELLHGRLVEQAAELGRRAAALNDARLETFGQSRFELTGSERLRTDNNSTSRDMAAAGPDLLFGYNVFIGLKTETTVDDVFSLHRFDPAGDPPLHPLAETDTTNWLHDPAFLTDFRELYTYYKDAHLLQLRRTEGRLLAVFQTGKTLDDIRVFRWTVDADGGVAYLDNRGERDHTFPPQFDFEWQPVTRDHHTSGRRPYINLVDRVFVDPLGGSLDIRLENNTTAGETVLSEPVDDPDQSLADSEASFAVLGDLVLVRILPYQESTHRYYVVNTFARAATRIDEIGRSCQQLPEDHGLIFPGGVYLRTGEHKVFEVDTAGMEFESSRRSPNGEDVLYAFHQRSEGRTILLSYNLIRREVAPPIDCHGFSLFDDGQLMVFRGQDEPTRVHPVQIWTTPFVSDDFHARQPVGDTFLHRVGNAELVRGISEALSIQKMVADTAPSAAVYDDLATSSMRVLDEHWWMENEDSSALAEPVREIRATAELIINEFEKVQQLEATAVGVLDDATARVTGLIDDLRGNHPATAQRFVESLQALRAEQGRLVAARDVRYVDAARLDALDGAVAEAFDGLADEAVDFLSDEEAFAEFHTSIGGLEQQAEAAEKVVDLAPITADLDTVADGLDLLAEVVGSLDIADGTVRTEILQQVSGVLAALNRSRAVVDNRQRTLVESESSAAFGVEFGLFAQSLAGELARATTPDKCDQALGTLLVRLENLEGQFGAVDDHLEQIATKREDVYESFSTRKQQLIDDRQRQAGRLVDAAERILESVTRRVDAFESSEEIGAFFVSDPMVAKVRSIGDDLRGLEEGVRADEVLRKLDALRDDAARSLRDRTDIFEDGGQIIRLGRHRFSVDTQSLALTTTATDEGLQLLVTGTDYREPVTDAEVVGLHEYWEQPIASESPTVYRSAFLAASILHDAFGGGAGLDANQLREAAATPERLAQLVQSVAETRFDEAYDRGVHDHDAARILDVLVGRWDEVGLLRFRPGPRSLAITIWARCLDGDQRDEWHARALSLGRLRSQFHQTGAITAAVAELTDELREYVDMVRGEAALLPEAAAYLFEELTEKRPSFAVSAAAVALRDRFHAHLAAERSRTAFDEALDTLADDIGEQIELATAWVDAYAASVDASPAIVAEVVGLLTIPELDRSPDAVDLACRVDGLLGRHPTVTDQAITFSYDELIAATTHHQRVVLPGFHDYQRARHAMLERAAADLRIEEFRPKVMSAFVRNRLIDEVYLPLIGDNLAKQLGTVDGGRTDQMGLLMLISPPGYGKTTLMEYVANRLGLVFVKIDGPALGVEVTSLDPDEAPNATAAQEVTKLNFALEMGNNVLLYLDDIQHTNPELLQKFIPMCDAQRRMEGVWKGTTRAYDLRGKRFAVCMAGNPYTESGDRFQIPDMLANRADTYNLGDVLSGRDHLFALSYLENSLTSNPVTAQLAGRDADDVHRLIAMARGDAAAADDLSHPYSSVEIDELAATFQRLLRVQEVLLAVNQAYIASASMADEHRVEPPFRLQGSYRNMNRLAEKVLPVMTDEELERLIDDHYAGEAQTLTTGAEANVLKLAELRGVQTDEQAARWEEIKEAFARTQLLGGADDDPMVRVASAVTGITDQLRAMANRPTSTGDEEASSAIARFDATLRRLMERSDARHRDR